MEQAERSLVFLVFLVSLPVKIHPGDMTKWPIMARDRSIMPVVKALNAHILGGNSMGVRGKVAWIVVSL
jgi:hypothetical protein